MQDQQLTVHQNLNRLSQPYVYSINGKFILQNIWTSGLLQFNPSAEPTPNNQLTHLTKKNKNLTQRKSNTKSRTIKHNIITKGDQ